MNLQCVNVKVFVEGELSVDLERFIEAFHAWVAEQSMDELLIDVADYRHMHHGPGVVLVGHEADYSIDHTGGRFGLRYNRKAPLEGSNADRFRQALASAGQACSRLEKELEGLKFSRQELEVFINDRALAPNDEATRETLRAELSEFFASLGQSDCEIALETDSRRLTGAIVGLAQPLDLESVSTTPTA